MGTNDPGLDTLVAVTDYFAGGETKRSEILTEESPCDCTAGIVCDCGWCECDEDESYYGNQNPNKPGTLEGVQDQMTFDSQHAYCGCGCVCDCGECDCPQGGRYTNQNPAQGGLSKDNRNNATEAGHVDPPEEDPPEEDPPEEDPPA